MIRTQGHFHRTWKNVTIVTSLTRIRIRGKVVKLKVNLGIFSKNIRHGSYFLFNPPASESSRGVY